MLTIVPTRAVLREQWRQASNTARMLDRVAPRWWDNSMDVEGFMAPFSPAYRRMWEQLIRQRRGE